MDSQQPDFKPVYILGAGASEMLGAPLVKTFLSRAKEIRYSPDFKESAEEFDRVFKYQGNLYITRQFLGIDLDNLETLFSILDMDWQISTMDKKSKSSKYSEEELKTIRESFIALVIETLKRCIKTDNSTYKRIIQNLAYPGKATFITLNYDTAIENALEVYESHGTLKYSVDYGYGKDELLNRPHNQRLVLKLHGSANWTYCNNCKEIRKQEQLITPQEFEKYKFKIHKDSCTEHSTMNVIVPPTWYKYNYLDAITRVWNRSIKEISVATHLFIIGYSFPRTDVFFDQLVTLGLRESCNLKKVIIINPSMDVENILAEFFDKHFLSKKVIFIQGKFQDIDGPIGYSHLLKPINSEQDIKSYIDHTKRAALERIRNEEIYYASHKKDSK